VTPVSGCGRHHGGGGAGAMAAAGAAGRTRSGTRVPRGAQRGQWLRGQGCTSRVLAASRAVWARWGFFKREQYFYIKLVLLTLVQRSRPAQRSQGVCGAVRQGCLPPAPSALPAPGGSSPPPLISMLGAGVFCVPPQKAIRLSGAWGSLCRACQRSNPMAEPSLGRSVPGSPERWVG